MVKSKVIVSDIFLENDNKAIFSMNLDEEIRENLLGSIYNSVKDIFGHFGGGKALLKSSGNVYLKPNGIDTKPYCYTRPEV